MKKTLKISVLLTVGIMMCCAFGSCKSSKSADGGVMYNQKPRKNSQTINSNYRVVGENVIEYSAEEPII